MGIMTRFVRLCKADMHGVMDQLEDKDLLVKQLLRDMEEELGRKESRMATLRASREQTKRAYEQYSIECEKLDDDVTAAIQKNKDDIARMILKKVKQASNHRDELKRQLDGFDRVLEQLKICVAEQRLQYDQLQLRSRAYVRAVRQDEWGQTVAVAANGFGKEPSDEEIELELLKRKDTVKGGATS